MSFSRRAFSRRHFLQVSGTAALAPWWTRFSSLGAAYAATDPDTAAICHKLAADPLRPQYHLLPAHNWMNDPNGPIYFRGRYHMFHQYNPQGAVWGNMNWAHATSPDMIHWEHEPIAISPTPNGYDRDGVFSGSAVLDNDKPTVIYTGVQPTTASDAEATLRDGTHVWREVQCLAVAGDDDLRTWIKRSEPVISAPPAGLSVTGFRDPYVWREGSNWMLILGSGFYGKGGAILLYSSPDLRHWTYLHPLVEGPGNGTKSVNPVDTGEMWECPDFFPLGPKHVLLISTMGKVRWKVGTYANQRFTPEKEGVVDWGSYYAAKTMLDKDGQRILWGWISEARPEAELIKAGWAGAMSLPRELRLTEQNELVTSIVHAAVLRGTHQGASMGIYERGPEPPKEARHRREIFDSIRIHDLAAELDMIITSKDGEFTLHLQDESGSDFAAISCITKPGQRQVRVNNIVAPLAQEWRPAVALHLFLDGSVLELFANALTALTARIYKTPSGPLRLRLDEGAEIISINFWDMKAISKDRLTGSLCS